MKKFVKHLKPGGNSMDDLARAEAYIKTNFLYKEKTSDADEQLDQVLKNKYADSRGFTRLYAALLNMLNIPHQLVLANDRFDKVFDPSFDTWNYLGEYLIYIDGTKQFLSPKDMALRLGSAPSPYIGTYALFIKPEQVQNFVYPVVHIARIPEPSWSSNSDNINMTVSFSPQLTSNTVNVERSFTGYEAEYYKTGCLILDNDRKQDLLNSTIKYFAEDAKITSIDISGANTDYTSWQKPFIVKSTFTTSSYIESAGNAVLFSVGDLIGPQTELYDEKQRVSEVVNDYNRGYLREIDVQIPEGYLIKNPDDLIIKKQAFDNNKLVYNFVSGYTLSGQDLKIQINEFYDQLDYPVDKFEDFRKVVNASADWNKIVLVLVPKS